MSDSIRHSVNVATALSHDASHQVCETSECLGFPKSAKHSRMVFFCNKKLKNKMMSTHKEHEKIKMTIDSMHTVA